MTGETMAAIAICGARVEAVAVIADAPYYHEAIREWACDPRVTEIVRVPIAVAREFAGEQWPGREHAIKYVAALSAALAQPEETGR